MSWQGQISTMVRHLINDVDPSNYKYSDSRLEKSILVSSYLVNNDATFPNDYQINIEGCNISPDPTDSDTKDEAFVVLTAYKTASLIVGSEIKTEAGNAISIKDGPSAIDLRGVASTLTLLYKDLSEQYAKLLYDYKEDDHALAGKAILGPYSPGSDLITRNYSHYGDRGGYLSY